MPEGGHDRRACLCRGGPGPADRVRHWHRNIRRAPRRSTIRSSPPSRAAGDGLGLSVSYGIIKEHAGTLTAESAPGEGSRFIVSLPISESRSGGFLHGGGSPRHTPPPRLSPRAGRRGAS
jgi:hypothetical protein